MADVDVTTITFASHDGTTLEGDLLTPADSVGAAVVCHPHPLYGGDRRDIVVAALSRGLVDAGMRVLRFDFRGVGGSAGCHGGGPPEQDDLLAAIDTIADGGLSVTIAGYSFGADVALSVAHDAASGWLVAAPPLMVFPPSEMVAGADPRPVHLIVGGADDVAAPHHVESATSEWVATDTTVIGSADHFFSGAAGRVSEIATSVARGR
jgi:hypothetical protein